MVSTLGMHISIEITATLTLTNISFIFRVISILKLIEFNIVRKGVLASNIIHKLIIWKVVCGQWKREVSIRGIELKKQSTREKNSRVFKNNENILIHLKTHWLTFFDGLIVWIGSQFQAMISGELIIDNWPFSCCCWRNQWH